MEDNFGTAPVQRWLTAVAKAEAKGPKIADAQRALRPKVKAALDSLNIPAGQGITLWRPLPDGGLDMEIGCLVPQTFDSQGEVVSSSLPPGRAAHLRLVGPFDGLPGAYQKLFAWLKEQGLAFGGTGWEIYGDNTSGDPAKQETWLYLLLA